MTRAEPMCHKRARRQEKATLTRGGGAGAAAGRGNKGKALRRNKDNDKSGSTSAAEAQQTFGFLDALPESIILCEILPLLNASELMAVSSSSQHLSSLASCTTLWHGLFKQRWGQQPLHEAAAQLAGGWQRLYKEKHVCDKTAAAAQEPYEKPCCFEVEARLHSLASQAIQQQQQQQQQALSSEGCQTLARQGKGHERSSANHQVMLPSSPPYSATSSLSFPPSPPHLNASAGVSTGSPSGTASAGSFSSCSSFSDAASPAPSPARSWPPQELLLAPKLSALPPAPPACQILYLIDGSGSVSDEDFGEMRSFVKSSADTLSTRLQGSPENKAAAMVGIIQFSHEPHLELKLTAFQDGSELAEAVDGMTRINGGTNIEAALNMAGSMMSTPTLDYPAIAHGAPTLSVLHTDTMGTQTPTMAGDEPAVDFSSAKAAAAAKAHAGAAACTPPPARIVILLTDGRVDRYQVRGARSAAKRLTANVPGGGCVLAAFGVGKGVECGELMHIIDVEGAGHTDTKNRYLDLFVRDDPGSW